MKQFITIQILFVRRHHSNIILNRGSEVFHLLVKSLPILSPHLLLRLHLKTVNLSVFLVYFSHVHFIGKFFVLNLILLLLLYGLSLNQHFKSALFPSNCGHISRNFISSLNLVRLIQNQLLKFSFCLLLLLYQLAIPFSNTFSSDLSFLKFLNLFVVILSETTSIEDTCRPTNLIPISVCSRHKILLHFFLVDVANLLGSRASVINLVHLSFGLLHHSLLNFTQVFNFALLLSINVKFMLFRPLIVGLAIHLFLLLSLFDFLLSKNGNF